MDGFEALKMVFNSKMLMDKLQSPPKKCSREYKIEYSRKYYQTHKEKWKMYYDKVNQEEQKKYQVKYRKHHRPINYKYIKYMFPEETQ
jgi:hypothetical protein